MSKKKLEKRISRKSLIYLIGCVSVIGITIIGIIIKKAYYPTARAPAPTPESIHKKAFIDSNENCSNEILKLIQNWAKHKGWVPRVTHEPNRIEMFIIPRDTHFIEFFYIYRLSPEKTKLSLGLIPSRHNKNFSNNDLELCWLNYKMEEFWSNVNNVANGTNKLRCCKGRNDNCFNKDRGCYYDEACIKFGDCCDYVQDECQFE